MILTVTLNVAIDKLYVVDHIDLGEVIRVKECNYTAGGKGINVSRVARLLDEEVTATGFIGGYSGEFVRENVRNARIQENFIKVNGESRSCINIVDRNTGKQTEFLEPGLNITDKNIEELIDHYELLCKSCDIVTISGSVPIGGDETIYPRLIEIAKRKGKKVILDTSGKLLKAGIDAKPTVIKPNIEELKQLLGMTISSKEDIIHAASELHNSGIEIVIVSLGKDGAMIVCKEGVYQGTTPDIKVLNTVGCGDSMVAGFAVGITRDYKILDTIRLGMAVSTANALTMETGYFDKEDMEKLFCEIEVIKIR